MPTVITTSSSLDDVVAEASAADRYAIDTEFHRERTYYPKVALVQLGWADQVVLIDPLQVDLSAMAKLLDGPGTCILHAGIQDLEVLDLNTGTIPSEIFDTQIAAGFLGLATSSLASLLDHFMSIKLPKGDRLTDWLRRPLTDDQLRYAASDVQYLITLADLIEEGLREAGRMEWAVEESNIVRERPRNRRNPDEAVLRIKEARSLKGASFKAATALAAWRERTAAKRDVPVRQVLADLGVVAVSQQMPKTVDQLRGLRGVEGRHLKGTAGQEILDAVAKGVGGENPGPRVGRSPELPRHLRPVVSLVTAWIAQLSRDNRIDPALLATRADVEAALRGDSEVRILHGWRSDMVGDPIAQLVSGDAAVGFDGDGRLVLEKRSRIPLEPRMPNSGVVD